MSLFGRTRNKHLRPVTVFNIDPEIAKTPNPELEERLTRGRARLDGNVARAERSVASLYHQFAEQASERSRS